MEDVANLVKETPAWKIPLPPPNKSSNLQLSELDVGHRRNSTFLPNTGLMGHWQEVSISGGQLLRADALDRS